MNGYIPTVIEHNGRSLAQFDLPSRLLQDRIIILNDEITDITSYGINMQLLYLDSKSNDNITIYINSPGGSVYAGLAIYDTINTLKSKVNIVGTGLQASMGAFLLCTVTGKRMVTKESRIMLHSVSSGTHGTVHDQKIDIRETEFLQDRLMELMANKSNLSVEAMEAMTMRDKWLSAKEALELGLIDEII